MFDRLTTIAAAALLLTAPRASAEPRLPDPVPFLTGAPSATDRDPMGPNIRPDVSCTGGACALRLKAFAYGDTWTTAPMVKFQLFEGDDYWPWPLATEDLGITAFGYGWRMGHDAQAVELIVQPVGGTRAGTDTFIVEIRGGFEEIRQHHRVIEIVPGEGPVEHLSVNDGDGPFTAELLWDIDGFTHVVKSYVAEFGSRSARYEWRRQGGARRLEKVE